MPIYLTIVGLGAAIYHPAGMALISHTVRKRGYALGVNGVFGSLGIASAPLVTGVLTWLFGWETALVIIGLVGIGSGKQLGWQEAFDQVEHSPGTDSVVYPQLAPGVQSLQRGPDDTHRLSPVPIHFVHLL